MVAVLALAVPAAAAAQDVPAPVATPPGCVGLVLSGGGARGAAHIGVLKVMEREDLIGDERYATPAARSARRAEVDEIV